MLLYHKFLLQKILELEKQLDKDIKKLPIEQVKSLKVLAQEIGLLIGDADPESGVLSLSDIERAKQQIKFSEMIQVNTAREQEYEIKAMDALLHVYTINRAAINESIDMMGGITNIPFIDLTEVNGIVSSSRLGRTWVEREGINKAAFEKEIMGEVDKFLSGQTKAKDIQKIVKNKYGLNAHQAETLVRTEIATAQSEVNDLYSKKQGVQTQLFMSTLDNKTSKICQKLDGTEWNIDDPKKPTPGIGTHPMCRSVLLNQPFPGWTPSTRRDNREKEKIIPYQKYDEWNKNKDEQVKKYTDIAATKSYNKREGILLLDLQFFATKYNDYEDSSLKKALKSHEDRLKEHEDKIKNPIKYYPNWNTLDERHKKGAINNWEKEISNFNNQIKKIQEEIDRRSNERKS